MQRFEHRQLREAIAHALEGGQALHVWSPGADAGARWPKAPAAFKRNASRWGHLFDQDAERLVETARRLGVRRVAIDRRGEPEQHVDLCGKPLDRAITACSKPEQLSLAAGLALALVIALAGCTEGDSIHCYGPDAADWPAECVAAFDACTAEADAAWAADARRMDEAAASHVYGDRMVACSRVFDACVDAVEAEERS